MGIRRPPFSEIGTPLLATKLLIIQVGTPPEDIRNELGDIGDWFRSALKGLKLEIDVIRVFEGKPLPRPNAGNIAIITGSWAMVTDREPWSELTAQWIREAMEIEMPLFGVCYGHQLMSHALGGVVGYHPAGREMGCEPINLTPGAASDPLMATWPQTFKVHLTHEQTVISVPRGALVLASSAHDPHQIVRYGRNAISTQFHPEFTETHLAACIKRRAVTLASEGKDPEVLLDRLRETPYGLDLLRQFVREHS